MVWWRRSLLLFCPYLRTDCHPSNNYRVSTRASGQSISQPRCVLHCWLHPYSTRPYSGHAEFGVFNLRLLRHGPWLYVPAKLAFDAEREDSAVQRQRQQIRSGAPATAKDPNEVDWDDAAQVDVVSLELGYGLIPMVDEANGGRLLNRIMGIRKKVIC